MVTLYFSPVTATSFAKTIYLNNRDQSKQRRQPSLRNNVPTLVCCCKEISTMREYNNSHHITTLNQPEINQQIPAFTPNNQVLLKNGVRKIKEMMSKKGQQKRFDGDLEELIMIDAIQRLGLDYYFQEEIHGALQNHYAKCRSTLGDDDDGVHSLHGVALRFRLLRQGGHNPPVDIFTRFKNDKGKFKEEYCKDIKGLMSLFEASQMSIQGDEILDEAGEFSKKLLQKFIKTTEIEELKATIIRSTLNHPSQRSLPRLTGKNFLLNFENSMKFLHDYKLETSGWIKDIQDIARMELSMAQITHQHEIAQVSRWWNQLSLNEELKRARIQPIKWHMWSLAAFPNPSANEERIQLTKAACLLYIMDDIFDVYAKLEDLIIFTKAVNQWVYVDSRLPSYMNLYLKAFYETTEETSAKIYAKYGWNPKEYLKEAWTDICNAFLVEIKWFESGKLPNTEEYLKNGIISSAIPLLLAYVFYLLGQGTGNKSIKSLEIFPDVIKPTATILRLLNDLGSATDENQNGHDGSYIDCYIKEHQGSCAKEAKDSISRMVSDAWKWLNENFMLHPPPPFSTDSTKACLNIARFLPMVYNYDENNRRLPDLESHMQLFLYEKINS